MGFQDHCCEPKASHAPLPDTASPRVPAWVTSYCSSLAEPPVAEKSTTQDLTPPSSHPAGRPEFGISMPLHSSAEQKSGEGGMKPRALFQDEPELLSEEAYRERPQAVPQRARAQDRAQTNT